MKNGQAIKLYVNGKEVKKLKITRCHEIEVTEKDDAEFWKGKH
jgi:hypothetical protein